MRTIALLSLFASGLAFGQGSSLQDYLAHRNRTGIREAVGVSTLETLVGKRTAEIKGVVKGSIRMGESGTLMVETASGTPISVSASPIPDWMMGGSVSARLLVRAERAHETAPLRAELIAAIAEETMTGWEAKQRPRPSATPPRTSVKPTPSRSGARPAPMPGNIPGAAASPTVKWQVPASDAVPFYRDFIRQQNKRLSLAEAERIAKGVIGFSIQYGVDARLVMAMIMVESGFNPNVTSRKGAMGLGQLMPGTARGLGVNNAYDSIENLNGMVKLIRGHIDNYSRKTNGDSFEALVLTLAAYNAGSGAVRRHGGVPPYKETQNYVRKVTSIYRQLCGED